MTIDEAIKNLTIELSALPHEGTQDWYASIRLGIEALKAIAKMRYYPFPDEILKLPGETKD